MSISSHGSSFSDFHIWISSEFWFFSLRIKTKLKMNGKKITLYLSYYAASLLQRQKRIKLIRYCFQIHTNTWKCTSIAYKLNTFVILLTFFNIFRSELFGCNTFFEVSFESIDTTTPRINILASQSFEIFIHIYNSYSPSHPKKQTKLKRVVVYLQILWSKC